MKQQIRPGEFSGFEYPIIFAILGFLYACCVLMNFGKKGVSTFKNISVENQKTVVINLLNIFNQQLVNNEKTLTTDDPEFKRLQSLFNAAFIASAAVLSLFVLFYIPVKLQFASMEVTQAADPGTKKWFTFLFESLGRILVTASPLITGLIEKALSNLVHS